MIGWLLDQGKCKLSYDLPDVNVLPSFTNPDTNTSMEINVPVDCHTTFATCLADNEQAIIDDFRAAHPESVMAESPDIQLCVDMWQFLFLGSAALTLIASLIFGVTAVGDNMDEIFSGGAGATATTTGVLAGGQNSALPSSGDGGLGSEPPLHNPIVAETAAAGQNSGPAPPAANGDLSLAVYSGEL